MWSNVLRLNGRRYTLNHNRLSNDVPSAADMGVAESRAYLAHLAICKNVAASLSPHPQAPV
jgi:hypothetical protein